MITIRPVQTVNPAAEMIVVLRRPIRSPSGPKTSAPSGRPISEAAKLDMPTITGVILEELLARVEAGMDHKLPVPLYYMQDGVFHRDLL